MGREILKELGCDDRAAGVEVASHRGLRVWGDPAPIVVVLASRGRAALLLTSKALQERRVSAENGRIAARRALLLVLATLIVACGVCAAGADAAPTASLLAPAGVCGPAADRLNLDAATAERAMLCLTNYARRHSGRKPLAINALLARAGQVKLAADVSCGDFSHSPCGQPFQSVFGSYVSGASWYTIGENIAWSTGRYGTPRQTMNSWLNSPEHLQNILDSAFHDLGIGYLSGQSFQGTTGATLWSQEFGGRSRAAFR